jgi:hypothetical protein
MRSLHLYHPPLVEFAQRLSRELGYAARINAYITPPDAQAVDVHFDIQDVFVLQIEGEKEWHIQAPAIEKPIATEEWHEMGRSRRESLLRQAPAASSLLLTPGDVLYLPRGYLHEARATDSTSVQLTVAVMTMTRYDLFQHAARAAHRDDWFREAIPLHEGANPEDHVSSLLAEGSLRLQELITGLPAEELLWNMACGQSADLLPAPVGIIPDPAIVPRGNYVLRPGVRYRLAERGDSINLLLQGRTIVLPKSTSEVLAAVFNGVMLETEVNPFGISSKAYFQVINVLCESGVIVRRD